MCIKIGSQQQAVTGQKQTCPVKSFGQHLERPSHTRWSDAPTKSFLHCYMQGTSRTNGEEVEEEEQLYMVADPT